MINYETNTNCPFFYANALPRPALRQSFTAYVLSVTMRAVSAVTGCAALALVSGGRWSCQAESSPVYSNTHHLFLSVSFAAVRQCSHHLPLSISRSDWLIIRCPAQRKNEPCITAPIAASKHSYEDLYTHTHTQARADLANTHIKNYKRRAPFFVSVSYANLAGHT